MLGARQYGDVLSNYVKAGSQSCSPELLEAMAHSDVDRIRLRVAENPRTPIDILEVLAADKNADVRVAVGTNPSTPPYISYKLAFDEDINVRLGLADDVHTPIELLETLTEDANPYVSYRAVQTKDIVLSQGKPRRFGRRFIRWLKEGMNKPELRYA
ncbi:MAG: hypothetical protein K2W82_01155 [Candidatus Obscuribacterales bacterium]|nr:hypothetical protein [Candidatus Obscuribacterales bacterium]